MRGTFEIFHDEDKYFRFRLTAPDGTGMVLSRPFPDKAAAVAGISEVSECAGMGLIADLCPDIPLHGPPDRPLPAAARTVTPLSTTPPPARPTRGLPAWAAAQTPAGPGYGTHGPHPHKAA